MPLLEIITTEKTSNDTAGKGGRERGRERGMEGGRKRESEERGGNKCEGERKLCCLCLSLLFLGHPLKCPKDSVDIHSYPIP